jgi:hypothetical protein
VVEALLQIGIEDGRINMIDIVGDADRLHSAVLALPVTTEMNYEHQPY